MTSSLARTLLAFVTRSLDLALWALGAVAWGLATYAISSRFISDSVAGLLGVAVGFSGMAWVLTSHLRDMRLSSLTAGSCPSCKSPIRMDHRHRSWDPSMKSWTSPSTSWECAHCGYSYAESWACPQCPAP
jgi:hypothetical protein